MVNCLTVDDPGQHYNASSEKILEGRHSLSNSNVGDFKVITSWLQVSGYCINHLLLRFSRKNIAPFVL